MTEPAAESRRSVLLPLLGVLTWLAVQVAAVDVSIVFAGFSVDAPRNHGLYSLCHIGAWLVALAGSVAMYFHRSRPGRLFIALALGALATYLQYLAVEPFVMLYGTSGVRPYLVGFGAAPLETALAAPLSTASLALFALLVGWLRAHRPRVTAREEARRQAVILARSIRFRNFNPFTMLFGPVFQADVRVTGRRRSTYVVRAVHLLLLLVIVTIGWFGMRADMDYYSGAMRLQRMQRLAPQLALALFWTQFVLILLIAPMLTAPVICQERTGRTLPALLTTPLTSAQIIFGKLAGRLTVAFILILLSVPLLLGVRVYGGLDASLVLQATAVTLSATVLTASLGLLASIWSRRAGSAAVCALIAFIAYIIGVPLLLALLMRNAPNPPEWVFIPSPFFTMLWLTADAMGGAPPFFGPFLWLKSTIHNLVLAAIICLIAVFAFRRVMLAEAQGRTVTVHRKRKKRKRAAAAPRPAADPAAPPESVSPAAEEGDADLVERGSRTVGVNPVLWREIRQTALGGDSAVRTIIALIGGVGLILLLNLYFSPGEEALHYIVLTIGMVLLCISAAVAATGTVASEREAGSWTILLTTPLRASEILLAKFAGACRRCWILPALMLLDLIIAVGAGVFEAVAILHVTVIIVATIVFLCGTGTFLSLLCRKVTTAGVVNLAIAIGLWLASPLLFGFMFAISHGGEAAEAFFTVLVAVNPVPLTVIALDGASDYGGWYDMPTGSMSLVEFTVTIVIGMGALAAAGAGSLLAAVGRFRLASERAS